MTDNGAEPEKLPTATRLVGIDLGHTIRVFDEYRPFGRGERVEVDPPGTFVVVRGSRTVETEDGKLVLEHIVERERPSSGVSHA